MSVRQKTASAFCHSIGNHVIQDIGFHIPITQLIIFFWISVFSQIPHHFSYLYTVVHQPRLFKKESQGMYDDHMFEDDASSHSSYDPGLHDPYYRLIRCDDPLNPRLPLVTEYEIRFMEGGGSRGKCM